MRILVPLPFDISCLEHGRNLRIVHLLRKLAAECEITCAAGDGALAEAARLVLPGCQVLAAPTDAESQAICSTSLHGSWVTRRAADFFGYDPALHAWIDRLSSSSDVMLGFDLPSAVYLTDLGTTSGRRVPAVCDLIDDPWLTFLNDKPARWSVSAAKTAIAVRVLRRRLLSQMDLLVAVAPADASSLARATHRPVRVVPNGVEIPVAATVVGPREPLGVFTGTMSFPPNEQASCFLVHSIWPQVRRMIPAARLELVGANPGPRVLALANEPGITVTGRVPDLGRYLRNARVAVAPMLSGTGMKNKVLEACANACPVVATSRAAAGIPTGPACGIIVADDPELFATHTAQLLGDASAATTLGRAGQDRVRAHFTWASAAESLRQALRDAALTGANTNPGMNGRFHLPYDYDSALGDCHGVAAGDRACHDMAEGEAGKEAVHAGA